MKAKHKPRPMTMVAPLGTESVHERADVPMVMTEPRKNEIERWLWRRQFERRAKRLTKD